MMRRLIKVTNYPRAGRLVIISNPAPVFLSLILQLLLQLFITTIISNFKLKIAHTLKVKLERDGKFITIYSPNSFIDKHLMPKKYLTVKEVSRLFGVTPLTIRNWDKRGKLMAYRHPVNNYRMYKIDDVESLLKGIESSIADRPAIEAPEPKEEKPKGPRKLEIDVL